MSTQAALTTPSPTCLLPVFDDLLGKMGALLELANQPGDTSKAQDVLWADLRFNVGEASRAWASRNRDHAALLERAQQLAQAADRT